MPSISERKINSPVEKWAEDLSGTLQNWKADCSVNMKKVLNILIKQRNVSETAVRYSNPTDSKNEKSNNFKCW